MPTIAGDVIASPGIPKRALARGVRGERGRLTRHIPRPCMNSALYDLALPSTSPNAVSPLIPSPEGDCHSTSLSVLSTLLFSRDSIASRSTLSIGDAVSAAVELALLKGIIRPISSSGLIIPVGAQ